MAPVIAKSQQAMTTEQKHVANICSPVHNNSTNWDIEFAECAVDHEAKILPLEEEPQMERPTRAYSIGSRCEHNRMFKQHMGGGFNGGGDGGGINSNSNEIEHCNVRVRAFSVGSRAKIPRCDLQRGVLTPKLQQQLKEKHCHSNGSSNYNISTDTGLLSSSISTTNNVYNNLKQLCTQRDKKSTSAPLLLIHKSQNSVDRMGDLMEIDFSIKHNSNSTNSRLNLVTSSHTSITSTITTTTNSNSTTTTATTTTIPCTTVAALNKTYNSKCVLASTPATTTTTTTTTTTSSFSSLNNNNSSNNLNKNFHLNSRKYNTIITGGNYSKQQQQQQQQQQQPQQQQITATDNGYLEMKPVGNQTSTLIIKQNQKKNHHHHNHHQNSYSELNQQKQTPKNLLFSSARLNNTIMPLGIDNNEQIVGYDVPPEKSSSSTTTTSATATTTLPSSTSTNVKISNLNANFSTSKLPTTITTTVLSNKNELKNIDADNNSNLEIMMSNDINMKEIKEKTPEKKYDIIMKLVNDGTTTTTTTATSTPIVNKQQECKLNKNILANDDYASMERKFDQYMTLTANPNSNNYNVTTTTPATCNEVNNEENKNVAQQQQQQHGNVNKNNYGGANALQQQQNANNCSGYEMLQIKSDKQINQRLFTTSTNNLNKDNNNKIPTTTINNTTTTTTTAITTTTPRPHSTNSQILNNLSNVSISTVTSCITTTTTTTTATTTTTSSNITNNCNNVIAQATSRPSSVNLEAHELYYASLDWPQCSQEANKTNNIDTVAVAVAVAVAANETVATLPTSTNVHNVYAKIDFDYSDSSSSSSKNI